MKSIRNDKHALGALGGAVVAIAVILVIAGAYLFILPLIPNSTIGQNTTVTVNSSQSQVSNGQYLGIQWQNVGGSTTPSAVKSDSFPTKRLWKLLEQRLFERINSGHFT